MRSMSRSRLVVAGLGLGVVGGFVSSLFKERGALVAAREAAGERCKDRVHGASARTAHTRQPSGSS
jgi:hypothetical protein